jgi:rubrerythrin
VAISCADSEGENVKETIVLEDNASKLYFKFTQEAEDMNIKKFFGALSIVEKEHIELIKEYL